MSLIDKIKSLPIERDLLMAGAVYSRDEYGGDCRHFGTLLDTDDLKALVESHEQMLRTSKELSFTIKDGNELAVDEWLAAIEAAEKLAEGK